MTDPAAPRNAPRCRRHPAARAGWECRSCQAALCPDCTIEQRHGMSQVFVCARCGGFAKLLTVHRTDAVPFIDRVLAAPRFPLSRPGLTAMAVVALVFTIFSYASSAVFGPALVVLLVVRGIYWGYIFSLIRGTGRGLKVVTTPDFSSVQDDLFRPALRGVLASSVLWVPALVYTLFADEGILRFFTLVTDPVYVLDEPVLLVILAAGFAYLPMALLCAATDVPFLDALNPVTIVRTIRRIGEDYWITTLALALLTAASFATDKLGAWLAAALPIPVASRWIGHLVMLYVPFVMARILGLLLYVHGDVLDWGSAHEYQEPVLPNTMARATEVEKDPGAAAGPAEARPAPRPPRDERPAAREESARLDLGTPPGDDVPQRIAQAIRDRALDQALRLYAAAPGFPPEVLSGSDHFVVGHAAARGRAYPLAIRALSAAAAAKDPVAPRALVALAQVYGDGVGDGTSAATIYRAVIERYPGTSFAEFALAKLVRARER